MENYFMQEGNLITVHFPSIIDLVEYKCPYKANKPVFARLHSLSGRVKWTGPTTRNSSQVLKGAMLGDRVLYEKYLGKMIGELRESTGQLTADYTQRIQKVVRRPKFNGYGDELDIHKVYQGQLDKAWRRTERIEVGQESKLVSIFIQIAGLAREDATDSLWRAAVAVLLMEELLKAGKSVKIVVGGLSEDVTYEGNTVGVSITVKEYNEQLSLERLAAMCHLGFYRTFGFACKACQPNRVRNSLGRTLEMTQDDLPLQFREDVHKGHAKFVVLQRSSNKRTALGALEDAYQQMKEFTNEQ